MLLGELVATVDVVAATSARNEKRDALAALLRRCPPVEVPVAVGFLVGWPRQGRIGVGYRTVAAIDAAPAPSPSLELLEVDATLTALAGTSGAGSVRARGELLAELFGRATEPEQDLLRRLLLGDLRAGALEGVVTDAVARAAEVPATALRRAVMLSGDLGHAAEVALRDGKAGLAAIGLSVLRPVQPMLAATSASVGDALVDAGGDGASVEWKLDGARIQAHRDGEEVRLYTRNLNDVTDRLPEVVRVVRSLPASRLVLDGEVLGFFDPDDGGGGDTGPEHAPKAFQDTMSRFGRDDALAATASGLPGLRPFFFDVLHAGGRDLVDEPLADRRRALEELTGAHAIPGIVTASPDDAEDFLAQALAAGHEGVMVKALTAPYQAGRRGKAWRKVKPVHLLDLVVIAAEWGYGRRTGWLSNLHLGARDPDDASRFVMVGKTFKGLTDALLTWQTAAFLERELGREGNVVHVRPELVVEIALDGVQASTRYPGGVALRFARVRRYRDDKPPAEADTIEVVQAMLPRR